jgi:membrane protease YdiL (CAAX protease family)
MMDFALMVHQGWPWQLAAATGLVITAVAMERSLGPGAAAAELFGFPEQARWLVALSLVGCGVGGGLVMLVRWERGLSLIPAGGLEPFVVLACLIGAAEEVVYRGWLQGRLAVIGRSGAVVLTALAHAGYKTALFVWPPEALACDLAIIAVCTAGGGILIGALREISRSVIPSLGAHVVFDLLLYGSFTAAPWWVW